MFLQLTSGEKSGKKSGRKGGEKSGKKGNGRGSPIAEVTYHRRLRAGAVTQESLDSIPTADFFSSRRW